MADGVIGKDKIFFYIQHVNEIRRKTNCFIIVYTFVMIIQSGMLLIL